MVTPLRYLVAESKGNQQFSRGDVRVEQEFSLSVRTNSLDPIINGPGLGRIIEQSHDCSWLRCLCGITQEVEIKER
jgi:hypothetical protein